MSEGSERNRHPYAGMEGRAFWRSSVGQDANVIGDWYRPKFSISGMRYATAGSCFAQHITRALKNSGWPFVDAEPAPPGLSKENWTRFGYGLYSARYGNVYTSRQLLQLIKRATGTFKPVVNTWKHGAGWVDPFRPVIEPDPFETESELLASQRLHLQRVATLFEEADLFIFTLGLTECWCSTADGAAYPLAPGVAGGDYSPAEQAFINLNVADVVRDMQEFFAAANRINPRLRFILTVSPVPLAATASDNHVVVATTYSKAVLRAACGELVLHHPHVDYFPSYEIIASHVNRGRFYEPDGRGITTGGVEEVMAQFFSAHPPSTPAGEASTHDPEWLRAACEEELLSAAVRPR
jgi:hypothetical protein